MLVRFFEKGEIDRRAIQDGLAHPVLLPVSLEAFVNERLHLLFVGQMVAEYRVADGDPFGQLGVVSRDDGASVEGVPRGVCQTNGGSSTGELTHVEGLFGDTVAQLQDVESGLRALER